MSIYHAPVITGPLLLCFEDNKAMSFYQTNLAGDRSNQGTLQCHITVLLGAGWRLVCLQSAHCGAGTLEGLARERL